MGVLSTEHTDHVADMASAKPRERQFQVVPVPGTFTRGRWKCWDYKDKPSNVGEILDFTDKADKGAQLLSMTAETQSQSATVANAQPSASGDALTHTVSEPQLQSSTVGVAPIPPVCSSSSAAPPIDVAANGLKESRTIVVTSIAPPPPVTPVRETPSVDALPVHDPNVNLSTVNAQLPPSTLTIVNENGTVGEEASSMLSPPLTLSAGTTTVSSSTSIPTGSLSPQSESSPTLPACSYVSCPPPNSFATPPLVTSFLGSQASNSFASPPSVINFMSPAASSVSSSSVTSFVNPPVAAVGTGATAQQPQQPAAHGLSRETSVVQSTPSATLSRQTSIASFTDSGVPIVATASAVSALPPIDGSAEDPTATGSAPSGPNVAIDNKIEQAMDLVKTHLTFAVREEVEILRSTIVDLESKVAHLESQNQVLKQFAPAEVVANLALLVQNAQQQKQLQQQIQQIPTAAVSSAQPVIVNTQPSHPVVVQQQPITATSPPPTPVVMQPQQAQTMNQGVTLHPQQPLASVTSAPLLLPSAAAASLGDSLVSSASFAASGPQAFPTTVPSPQTFPATAPGAQTFPAAVPESLGSPSSVIGGASGSSAVP